MGVPTNGWVIREHPMKMDDLGVPLFQETTICVCVYIYIHTYECIAMGLCVCLMVHIVSILTRGRFSLEYFAELLSFPMCCMKYMDYLSIWLGRYRNV